MNLHREMNAVASPTRTLLVAEDQPADVLLLRRAFAKSQARMTLRFVVDGQDAIDYLSGDHQYADRNLNPLPDLMLLDIKMPRLDGFEVLLWLRHQPRLRRLPVSILSSCALVNEVNRAYDLGVNCFLVKPQEPDGISDLVRRLEEFWLQINQGPDWLVE